jgi:hypothetical protein
VILGASKSQVTIFFWMVGSDNKHSNININCRPCSSIENKWQQTANVDSNIAYLLCKI